MLNSVSTVSQLIVFIAGSRSLNMSIMMLLDFRKYRSIWTVQKFRLLYSLSSIMELFFFLFFFNFFIYLFFSLPIWCDLCIIELLLIQFWYQLHLDCFQTCIYMFVCNHGFWFHSTKVFWSRHQIVLFNFLLFLIPELVSNMLT